MYVWKTLFSTIIIVQWGLEVGETAGMQVRIQHGQVGIYTQDSLSDSVSGKLQKGNIRELVWLNWPNRRLWKAGQCDQTTPVEDEEPDQIPEGIRYWRWRVLVKLTYWSSLLKLDFIRKWPDESARTLGRATEVWLSKESFSQGRR